MTTKRMSAHTATSRVGLVGNTRVSAVVIAL